MADIAVVGLELDTSKLEAQARRAEEWFQSVEKAADKVDASARKAGAGTKEAERQFRALGTALTQLPVGDAAGKMVRFASAIRNVAEGASPATLALTGLGAAAVLVAQQIVSMGLEGAKLADKMGKVAAETGKSYEQIQKLEKGGRDLTAQLSALDAVLDTRVIDSASRATDQFALLDKQWDSVTIRVAAELKDGFDDLGKSMNQVLHDATPGFVQLGKIVGEVMQLISGEIQKARADIAGLLGILSKISTYGTLGLLDDNLNHLDSFGGAQLNSGPPDPNRLAFSRSNEALRTLLAADSKSPTAKARGGGSSRESIDATTQALLNTIDVAAKLGRQTVPQLVDTLIDAQDDVQRLSQTLAVLSDGGYKTAKTMEELAKAQETLRQAQEKFFKSTGDALTEQLRKISLAQQTGLPPGVPVLGGIPGAGGFNPQLGASSLRDSLRGLFGIGAGQTFSGGIPGQFDPGQAPDPRGFRLTGLKQQFLGRNSGDGERIQGVGELIAQDFITGVLLGQADVRRAGENIAFFFADYFARKMTENLVKAFDPLFDVIGNAFTSLFSRIFGQIAGGIFGGIGGAGGAVAGSYFLAGGGPISASRGAIVGENGPEWFVPQSNGFIVNQQQAAAAVGGGSIQVTNYFSISAPNGQVDRRSLDQVAESSTFALSRAQRLRGA